LRAQATGDDISAHTGANAANLKFLQKLPRANPKHLLIVRLTGFGKFHCFPLHFFVVSETKLLGLRSALTI
jgi:hypothetical protein